MKKYYILLSGAILIATLQTHAQTKIGGTGAPDGSAMLEVTGGTGNNKGILPPRLTTAQRDAITLPAKALMIYNTTTNQLQVNTGTPAAPIWSVATQANAWNTTGNTGINPATNFIGTTDNQPLVMRTNNAEHLRIDTTGWIGLDDATPRAPLSFASVVGAKIRFWDNGSDTATYGIGLGPAQLNYHIDQNPAAVHRFLAGGDNEDGTELMRIQANGNVGINTLVPAAKLDVNGTVRINGSAGTPTTITGRNATGDIGNVALGAGLSLTGGTLSAIVSTPGWALGGNTGTNPATNYIGTTDAQPLVLRTNAAEHLRITSGGNVGINNGAPLSPLSFASAIEPKISLWDGGSATNNIGFGVSSAQLNYHVTPGATHAFFAGGKNGDGTELMRIQSDGNVGISDTTPRAPLSFASVVGAKIRFWDNGSDTATYGIGLGPAQLNYHVDQNPAAVHRFLAGGGNEDGTELMRIQANGNVGIGTTVPTAKLDVNGTARIQGSAGTPTAITGRDVSGNVGNITLGTGLSLAGGILSASPATPGWSLNGNAGTNGAVNYIGTTDAQPLVLRTNAAEHLRITSGGNIGINNGAPLYPLSFASAIEPKISLWDGGSATDDIGFGVSAGQLNYHVTPGSTHAFYAGGKNGDGTELMRIQSNGNVGINNGAPLSPLSFASAIEPKISFWDGGSTTDHIGIGVSAGQLNYHVTPGATHTFYAGGKNGDGTELMRIQSDGNVGIGTATPAAKLDVNGTARIVGNAGTPTAITGRDASGNVGNVTLGSNLSLSGGVLNATVPTAGWGLTGNAGTNPATNFIGTTDAQPLVFSANNDEKMRILPNGFVGIGTSTPTFPLQVARGNFGPFGGFAITDDAGANASIFTITPGFVGSNAELGVTLDVFGEGPITFSDTIQPAADNRFSCGTSAYRWRTVYAVNGIINTSDARMKKNVRNLGLGLDAVMKLRPIVYDWKDDSGKDKIGFIAQELRKVVPNVVTGDESKETLGVLYSDMVPVLTKAIQEQQMQIEALKAENRKLKTTEVELKENKAVTAQLMERVKQMEQMMGIKEIEGTSKVAGK
jgi:hypothetical protein